MEKELIANKYSGSFTAFGEWDFSGQVRGPMRSYAETMWLEGENTGYADYYPEITAIGRVRITAFIPGYFNQDSKIKIEIHHSGEIDVIYVDATKYAENNGDWLVLDTVEFGGCGDEFVRIVRESGIGTTRISTVKFEILNSADENLEVWQTIYVGPTRNAVQKNKLISLNKFSDIDGVEWKNEIEYLLIKGVIQENNGKFEPFNNITADEFKSWLCKILPEYESANIQSVTKESVVNAVYDAVLSSNANIEHIGNISSPTDALRKLDIIPSTFVMDDDVLTRSETAHILWKLYYFILGSVNKDEWKLSFYDDFDGECLNNNIWICENAPSAHILSSRWKENVVVNDSKLKLITKNEIRPECPGQSWTTGCVNVWKGVFSQAYGFWEASMKINKSSGINNAFWMAGNDFEIDIVEAHYMNVVNSTYHYPGGAQGEKYHTEYDLSDDFHIYALKWDEKELIYYFDGKEIFRCENFNAHKPVVPMFSSAVLNWAGAIDEDTADGCTMEVEWVRVYKQK